MSFSRLPATSSLSKISIVVVLAGAFGGSIRAADFIVQTPGAQFAFQINGVNSPTLTLVRGQTYTFAVSTTIGFHPFHIQSPGCDTNDISMGQINYTVPLSETNYYYNCMVHGALMCGEIFTVPPPSVQIV